MEHHRHLYPPKLRKCPLSRLAIAVCHECAVGGELLFQLTLGCGNQRGERVLDVLLSTMVDPFSDISQSSALTNPESSRASLGVSVFNHCRRDPGLIVTGSDAFLTWSMARVFEIK